ncbi:hypothetical protein AYO45_02705 [Gammaproteobacteria bacterium SCGC AG-212-F23]|nr:hypothetical protein AYO45_02705 [Gammaproteobacteria bacterium SCGC AG-212-F23]
MPKSYSRVQRVADLIQNTLADILEHEMRDPSFGLITITGVVVSPDFSHAKVYVSVLYDDKADEAVASLNEAAKSLRYQLANQIELRVTPQLKFYYDDSTVRGAKISSLINEALKNPKS